MKKAITN
ncbi:Protein of unknown function [Lactobacillus helveticus CIRM-BIA 104]|nr:Protein of unknown function [Lactobacillus helveticus CIRM-BIA 104]